jgi:hypothetical protein
MIIKLSPVNHLSHGILILSNLIPHMTDAFGILCFHYTRSSYFGLRCNTSYVVLSSLCICLSLRNGAITYKLVMKMVNIQVLCNRKSIMLTILYFVSFYHGGHDFFFKDVMGLELGHTTSDQVGVACPYPNHI